jgi:hypothetical protein
MNNDTCRAVAHLCDRMDPAKFFYCFAEHLLNCRSCRAFLDGPKLTEMASRFVFGLGNMPDDMLPPATVHCQQVEYLSTAAEEVDQRSFSRSFSAHILSCPRCLRLVPTRISPELLVPMLDSMQVKLAL